ncbi:hypothetical protein SAMN02745857_00500 [Andreprevotia lacus DSM 23236]|uniref:TnsE C-terminal domain-containing protein n=1 Tax=Andreprevotia lacus DSM 23236 TaxID=1121001 RepID=A0A1W1X2J8_9NEIS|nr:hypothetical protein [Andreprevotia lacus]SMC18186.1 hypothetical protein SAMN02745857_00500 [Andreprevotia lacus DSM 23236]
MARFLIKDFREKDEPLEIFWLTGLQPTPAEHGRVLRVVTKGMRSGELAQWVLPIDMLPIMALGRCFENGRMLTKISAGTLSSLQIGDLASGTELSSAELPAALYSFAGRKTGVQKLVRYDVGTHHIYIPTFELIRYFLAHNRLLAGMLMFPEQLLLLYDFVAPGIHDHLLLKFTRMIRPRMLSPSFAAEFAWLAVHPEGRASWDSVSSRSAGQPYMSMKLPHTTDCELRYRGIQQGNDVLVLEILGATGRQLPCNELFYSHPAFKQSVRHHKGGRDVQGGDAGDEPRTRDELEIQRRANGTRKNSARHLVEVPPKSMPFGSSVPIKKLWRVVASKPKDGSEPDPKRKKAGFHGHGMLPVGMGPENMFSDLPPIEFQLLTPLDWVFAGELMALAETIKVLQGMLVDTQVFMSLCQLPGNRAFVWAGVRMRGCLVVYFEPKGRPPVVLLDVDRNGAHALASMAVHFKVVTDFAEVEEVVDELLSQLVGRLGRWGQAAPEGVTRCCYCVPIPKVQSLRRGVVSEGYQYKRALALAKKLGLPLMSG